MARPHSVYGSDLFEQPSSFVVPIHAPLSSSPLHPAQSTFASPTLAHLSPGASALLPTSSPASSRSYRHSTLIEAGDYHDWPRTHPAHPAHPPPHHHPQQLGGSPLTSYPSAFDDPASSSLLAPQHLGHRQTRSVGRAPSFGQLAPHPQGHRAAMGLPSSTTAAPGGGDGISPASSAGGGHGTPARSRDSSNTRMTYSPNPSSPAGGDVTMGSYSSGGSTAGAHAPGHFRASPSFSSSSAVPSGPAASGMRRGASYDGGGPPGGAGAAARPPPLQTSLLPSSYAAGRPSASSAGAYTPMTGVQPTGALYTPGSSPSMHPPSSPSHPHRSYSPSHYAAAAPPSASTSAVPPPPMSSHYPSATPASSFYPQHIAQTYPSTSASTSHSTSALSVSPQPPPQSVSPAHHPHPQQYYQSQQYFDQSMRQSRQPRASSSSAAPPPASSSSHQHRDSTGANSAAAFHAGGTDLKSLSLGPSGSGGGGGGARGNGRATKGLRRVRDVREIERKVAAQPKGRRADPNGGFVSPLKALTTHLPQTYHLVDPLFHYETSLNPRRVLTKPSKPAQNDGFDNEDSDYILYVNDVLGPEDKDRYLILDVLGQGTFGQVVKCQNMKTHEIVAVKVVKNKPAYFQQSMMEVTILELINNQWDKDDEHHMLRLKDTFIHHSHLCLVFELLSNNLYELIKQNSFRGLSTSLVRVFTAQLLDALAVLAEAKIIHCDLKPENILLKSLQSPTIKVIDFGSACHEKQTVYTYIQSRFYRSPEVILSLPYSAMIDMWSLGCICVELFLGLPLFPGTSEFNQITRIVEMLGMPPDHMLDQGKQTSHFFETHADEYGRRRYRLKTLERYSQEYKTNEQPSKKYFSATTLPEIITQYPIVRKGLKEAEVDKEMRNRIAFIDFVQGLLHLDPEQRWTPQQARMHPFVLGEPLLAPFVPPPRHGFPKPSSGSSSTSPSDPKRPYGGLPPAPGSGQPRRTYDAKAYSQHLSQQQNYNVQAQQAAQRAAQVPTNPYAVEAQAAAYAQAQVQAQMQTAARQPAVQQQPLSLYGAAAGGYAPRAGGPAGLGVGGPAPATVANPPAVHHYTARGRSGTIPTQELPPALQKLGHDLTTHSGTGQSITPVLRRDDQWQAWERLHESGNGVQRRISISTRNPHLNLLQEQAESGLNSWNSPLRAKPGQPAYSAYYTSPLQSSQPQFSVVVDPGARSNNGNDLFDPSVGIAAPPLAYAAGNPSSRYAPYSSAGSILPLSQTSTGMAPAPPPGAAPPLMGGGESPFDGYDQHGASNLTHYQPMQPFHQQSPTLNRHAAGGAPGPGPPALPPAQMNQPNMYSPHVPASAFSPPQQQQQQQQQQHGGKTW
ncbi:hypothetical protein JCM21900_001813 [Sporobolomyces salmonicolor]